MLATLLALRLSGRAAARMKVAPQADAMFVRYTHDGCTFLPIAHVERFVIFVHSSRLKIKPNILLLASLLFRKFVNYNACEG